MTFKEAAGFRMTFGQYKGRTLDDIAISDEGLRYLDWLRGEFETEPFKGSMPFAQAEAYRHICVYLDHPIIAADAAKLART